VTGLPEVKALAAYTFRDPKAAARTLLGLGVPAEARWLGLALVSVLTLLVGNLSLLGLPDDALSPIGRAVRHPVSGTLIQAGSTTIIAAAMTIVGNMFGGRGQYMDALLLMVWLQFLLVVLALAQTVLAFVVPVAALLVALVSLVLFFWLMVQFASALHGFTRPWAVFAGLIGTLLALSLIAAVLMSLFGIEPPMPTV
jgi:Yip1 domain